jgi:hypothetical protein
MRLKLFVLTVVTCLVAIPASAQTTAACQPIFDGMVEQTVTPNHTYISMTGGSTMVTESITVGGVMFIQVSGKWMRSPTGPAEMQQQLQADEKSGKNKTASCQRLADELVNGAAAMVFHVQRKTDLSASDGKVWLSKATGLPLRGEEDVVSRGTTTHVSTRFEYTNVQAPPGIK